MILFPNRADLAAGARPGAVLDGGAGWPAPLGIGNLQDPNLARIARSRSTAVADTQFRVTLGAEREIRVVALIRHNLTVTASWRITAWYDEDGPGKPVFDQTSDVYPSLGYTEDLPWESESWWDGKPASEELEGYAQNAIMVLPAYVSARNWRIEIFDEFNPAGYVQAARLFMGGGWQPSMNYDYGGSIGIETMTTSETAMNGRKVFDPKDPVRIARIGFGDLPEDEALLKGLDLARRAGIHNEVFFIDDPNEPRTLTQTSFLGRIRQLPAWERVVFERAAIAYEIEEIL